MRKLGEWLLANDRNAIIVAFLCSLLPLIKFPGGFLASIIVGLVTLRKGYKSGLMILAWVALPAISLLVLRRFGVFDILLLRCILVWLCAVVLRATASWQRVLEVSALIGVLAVVVMHFIVPDMPAWWIHHITQYLNAADLNLSADETKALMARVTAMAPMATGIIGFVMLLGTMVELLLARWWESVLYVPGRLRSEFVNIRMSAIYCVLVLIISLGAVFHVSLLMDFFPLLLLPLVIAGLSVLHYFAGSRKILLLGLVAIYIALLFLPTVIVMALALIGFVDTWLDFRKRIKSDESNIARKNC